MSEKDTVITFLIGGALFLTLAFIVIIHARNVEKEYQINGVVNEVAFTEKRSPKLTIGGHVYFISFPKMAFINKIQVGDSIVKTKGSKTYKLIKKNSSEVILSN